MDLLIETARHDPQTTLEMAKLLLNTVEKHLQNEEAANQLLGWDLYDLLSIDDVLPSLVEELKWDDRLARQLFQRAYVNRAPGKDSERLWSPGREGAAAETAGVAGLQSPPP